MMIHKRIGDLIPGVQGKIFVKGLLGILVSGTYIVQAIFLGKIIGALYSGTNLKKMGYDLLIIISMLLTRIFLVWCSNVYGKRIVGKVKNQLRKRAYKKLLDLGPGYMTVNRTGVLESTIVAGIDYLEGYLTLYIPQIMVCIFGSGAMLLYIFHVHYILGIIALVAFLVALFSPVFFVSVISKFT
ncbi:MAG: ABC transporter transmembrane domain-containing protein, partial [Tissierellia bacterium]|nr:ABC transporter transmembrane domain-containing protein [Tissierellia bacterium]